MALLKYVSQTGRGMAWFEMAFCETLGERLLVCYNGFAQNGASLNPNNLKYVSSTAVMLVKSCKFLETL
jgi:hypothetical protein